MRGHKNFLCGFPLREAEDGSLTLEEEFQCFVIAVEDDTDLTVKEYGIGGWEAFFCLENGRSLRRSFFRIFVLELFCPQTDTPVLKMTHFLTSLPERAGDGLLGQFPKYIKRKIVVFSLLLAYPCVKQPFLCAVTLMYETSLDKHQISGSI